MAKDFSDVYEAIRIAEKEKRPEDVAKLAAYLETESAKRSEADTYDPKDQMSYLTGAGIGTGATTIGPYVAKKGMSAIEKAKAPAASVTVQSAPGSALADIEEATTKGLSNEITQQTRTAQRAARTEDTSKILAELKAKGLPVNPKLIAELETQYARPGSGILLPVERAKEIAAAEDAAKIAAANPPKASLGQRVLQQLHTPTAATSGLSNAANFVKGITDYRIPFTGIQTGPLLGRALSGLGAGIQGTDAWNRHVIGDDTGAAISGIGAIGTAATALPGWPAKAIGTGVGLSAEAVNSYRDAMRKGHITHGAPENYGNVDVMGSSYSKGGSIDIPTMAREILNHHLESKKPKPAPTPKRKKHTIYTLPPGLSKEEFMYLCNGGHVEY